MGQLERARTKAANEASDRRVNEAIGRGRWPGEGDATAFRCECGNAGCTEMVRLDVEEYEQVRASGRRFVVAAGHEDPEVEDVCAAGEGYVIVEKRGEAARVAERTDPRG